MNRAKQTKAKWAQQTPNFRSVGSKPCDFNRLKYTTTYRHFGRRSMPNLDTPDSNEHDRDKQKQKQRDIISLNLKINVDKERQQKTSPRKKIAMIIDKWKERYQKIEEQYLKKKGVFPTISRNAPLVMISTRQKFNILKKMHKNSISSEEQKAIFSAGLQKLPNKMTQSQLDEVFQKYDADYKQSWHKRLENEKEAEKNPSYSLELNRKYGTHLKFKKKGALSTHGLNAIIEEIPERWEVTQEDD